MNSTRQKSFLIILWALPSLCMERTISLNDFAAGLLQKNRQVIGSFITQVQSEKIDVNGKNRAGMTALMYAAKNNAGEAIRELVKVPGIEVNAQDSDGWTALMIAAQYNAVEAVRELVQVPGIEVNAKANNSWTALMHAIERQNIIIARILWAVGADDSGIELDPAMQKIKEEGRAVLNGIISAIRRGDDESLRKYQDQGYSVMVHDAQGNNSLHLAIMGNHPMLAKNLIAHNELLLKEGNKEGIKPLELLFGLWGDENEDWNKFIGELPAQFTPAIEEGKKVLEAFKEKAFKEGIAGMPVSQ
jgi:ankyrin repeat protein